jgi:hypothetical protein
MNFIEKPDKMEKSPFIRIFVALFSPYIDKVF